MTKKKMEAKKDLFHLQKEDCEVYCGQLLKKSQKKKKKVRLNIRKKTL